jgi:pimeloyl-ACP methyl ester carboxylesterase
MEENMLSSVELTNEAPSAPGATHQTARTQSVEVDGACFAYRRFGAGSVLPLVMLQHFRGNLDNWDPALTDALAREREVILVAAAARGESRPENLLYIMFAHTDTSQAKGREFLGRFLERDDRDVPTSDAARDAQYDAIVDWGIPDHAALQRLTGIQSPTLVIQGDNDLMIPTKLSHLLAGLIPHGQIRIYPDAAHGFLFQYPSEVAAAVNTFLTADDQDMRGAS